MKTYLFLGLLLLCCCKRNLDDRFMKVCKYVVEHCGESEAYDSLPARYTRALEMGRDSAERLVRGLEREMERGLCPE